MQAHLYAWLPHVSHYFPGITPINVNELTIDYWQLYVAHAKKLAKQTAETLAQRRQRRR